MQDDHPSNDLAEQRTDWAETRTDWAEDRTLLANERTFAGWMRTGLGSVGVALGLKAVFGAFDPTWAAKLIASVFIVVALVMFWSAERNARATYDRLCGHDAKAQSPGHFRLIAAIMAIGALGAGAILWML